jgi:hypothetical protein
MFLFVSSKSVTIGYRALVAAPTALQGASVTASLSQHSIVSWADAQLARGVSLTVPRATARLYQLCARTTLPEDFAFTSSAMFLGVSS